MKHAGSFATLLALALAASSPRQVSAQPAPTPAGGVDEFGQPTPPPVAEPPPPPPPEPTPEPTVAAAVVAAPDLDGPRPYGTTVGLGFGYFMPAAWDAPNVVSARLRLASGLTIEPRAELSTSSTSMDTGIGETSNSFSTLAVGANVRLPLASRGRGDFMLVGGAAAALSKNNPEGADNSVTTTSLALTWGVGIDYWLSRSFSISMTATNPVIAHTSTSFEAAGDDPSNSTTGLGVVFDPALDVMLHLYF
jgi:hypothetical protein